MKLPIEWLTQYVNTTKTTREIADSFTLLGLMQDKPVEPYVDGNYKTDILDLEHRMDRADWLSILGCARDFAAFEGLKLIYPELYNEKGETPLADQVVKIEVKCPDLVNRFNTRVFRNIKVQPSPNWLKNRLEAYGIPSINNVVDITNYVMVELGQPMHAQDLAKMEKQEIVIRRAKKGEKITTLLGEELELDENIFVLTQNDKATVIGGIVGGETTGIDEGTTDIVLDAGDYNQNAIRKNSRKLKILNETVSRYDKYLHPDLTELAIQRATKLILDLAGGTYYENIDWYPTKHPLKQISLRRDRLNLLSGMEFKFKRAVEVLESLGYRVIDKSSDLIKIEVPLFRTDVEVEDDLVADILRINNYSLIPISDLNQAPPKEITPEIYKFEDELRDICVNLGLHEYITDPLVGYGGVDGQIKLENALSPEKNSLRTEIFETLFPIIKNYKKRYIKSVGIFEIGKTYHKKHNLFEERRVLTVIYHNENLTPKEISVEIKTTLQALLNNIGIKYFYAVDIGGKKIIKADSAELGEIKFNSFSLNTELLLNTNKTVVEKHKRVITDLADNKTDDISLVMNLDQLFGEIYESIAGSHKDIRKVEVIDEYIDINANTKALLIRITHKIDKYDVFKRTLLLDLKQKYKIESKSS